MRGLCTRARRLVGPLALLVLSAGASAGVADTAWIAARSGASAPGVSGFSFNGLFADNAGAALPAPMMAGDLVTLSASLRQGSVVPPGDRGLWLLAQGNQSRLIARQGQAAPGTESGTQFQLLSTTTTDDQGRVLFISTLAGPAVDPAINYRGLWEADISGTTMVIREGDVAPGTSPVGHFYSLSEGVGIDGPLNADTAVSAYVRSLPGAQIPLPLTTGVWARAGTQMQMLCWSYGVPPGVSNVGIVEAFPVISHSGRGVYSGRLGGIGISTVVVNGVSVTNDWGVWRTGPTGQQLVARTASPAPGTPTGVVFWSLPSGAARPAANAAGDVVFSGMLAGPGITTSNWSGLWRASATGVSLLARSGASASAAGAGVTFDGLTSNSSDGTLAVLENGDAVFATYFAGTGVTLSNCRGIWKRSATGQDTVIARAGISSSALPAGTSLVRTMLPRAMKTSGNDHVMFTSQLSGTGVTTANDDVLLRHTVSGGLQLIAREGATVGNHVLKSFVNNGADMQITASGFAVVPVMVSPATNPAGTPVLGALGVAPSGAVRMLAATNHPIALSDTTFPTIGQLRIAARGAISDSGRVAMAASFGSGTPRDEGVFVVAIDSGYQPPSPCPADFDASGALTVQDIFAFLTAWFQGNADYDHSGTTEVVDIFAFLSDWYAGCP